MGQFDLFLQKVFQSITAFFWKTYGIHPASLALASWRIMTSGFLAIQPENAQTMDGFPWAIRIIVGTGFVIYLFTLVKARQNGPLKYELSLLRRFSFFWAFLGILFLGRFLAISLVITPGQTAIESTEYLYWIGITLFAFGLIATAYFVSCDDPPPRGRQAPVSVRS